MLILDEYDRLDPRQIPKFRRRLGSPTSMKLERAFSNPSFPETGIHARYLASDQREWLVSCRRCRKEAPLSWEAGDHHFVDEERAALVCGRCKGRLSTEAVASGRWVPGRPSVPRRGYHISRLIVPGQEISELIEEHHKSDEESVQTHYNFDLGLAYAARGGSLSRDVVLACRREYTMPPSYDGGDWVTAGVDVGRVLHVRISRRLHAGRAVPLHIGEIPDFEALALLWDRYGVNFGLVDERPEERKAREFLDAFRGRCMLIRWSGSEQRDPIVSDSDRGIVSARRTGACDRAVDAFQRQMRLLPRDVPVGYLSQVTAPHRVTETNPRGQKVARYVSERADDFFFAEVHDLLAHEVRGCGAAEAVVPPPPTLREQILLRRRRMGYGL